MDHVGIQRRTIYLSPPTDEDAAWICIACNQEDIWRNFGFAGPAEARMRGWFDMGPPDGDAGRPVIFVVRTVSEQARIGFAVAFPPHEAVPYWELAYAIVDPKHRNFFFAIHAADALIYYLFEIKKLEHVSWRTRLDNIVAAAVVARLGYPALGTKTLHGTEYVWHLIDGSMFEGRKSKLESREAKYPSTCKSAFAVLEAPFSPITSIG